MEGKPFENGLMNREIDGRRDLMRNLGSRRWIWDELWIVDRIMSGSVLESN